LFLITIICLFSVFLLNAQTATLKGTVTDQQTGEPLVGVNIVTEKDKGTTTNFNGEYSLDLEPGKWQVTFKYLSYQKITKQVKIKSGATKTLNVKLSQDEEELNVVVVSGSKYEKNISEETVSIDVMQPELLENSNSQDAGEAMQKMPGVSIVDDQPIIRSGAGYAYGAGSRVQVLVDGQPMLSGDFRDVNWSFIPIENAKQIEVIKGASSVLYGTGALNGVINVRTGYAKDKPETKLTVYQGLYGNPRNEAMIWWDREYYNPFFTGASFNHRQRYNNLDVVVGGNLRSESSYLQGANKQRGRLNFKTRYHDPSQDGLTYGVNGNIMYNQNGDFFLWQDNDTGALKPFGGYQTDGSTITPNRFIMATVDPHLTLFTDNDFRHEIKARYYNVTRLRLGNQNATSHLGRIEYQLQKRFQNEWTATGGILGSYSRSFSPAYNEEWHTFSNGGAYLQVEKKIGRLSLVAGTRYEFNTVDELVESSIPVFRAGLNYEPVKGTFLRASFGQGYRFPSIAERFVREDLSNIIKVFPNPELNPEKGWNAELGVKQAVKIGHWLGYLDLAAFWTEYDDMILFRFGQYDEGFGFKSRNTGRSRITGLEFTAMGEGVMGSTPVRLLAGYTYTYPVNLTLDTTLRNTGEYMSNFFRAFNNPGEDIRKGLARYRFRHMIRGDVEADINQFSIGLAARYNSFMDKIDQIFEGAIDGIAEYRENNTHGDLVLDARLGYHFSNNAQVRLLVKNLTNNTYSIRPAKLQPPINFTLQYKHKF